MQLTSLAQPWLSVKRALSTHVQSTERLAKADERGAVVAEYTSRVILVEMISEYAGTSLFCVGLWTVHRLH
jgi:hypothetical protein